MKPLVTVLYEDSIRRDGGGSYPLHDLVVRLVEEEISFGIQTWELHKLIQPVPRNGVDEVLKDVKKRTALFAGKGKLFLLLDSDRVAQHLKLGANAEGEQIVEAVKASSDAREKLEVFFLLRNVEGLLRSIRDCGPELVAAEVFEAAIEKKKLIQRDLVFAAAKKNAWGGRRCVRNAQPGLDAMVGRIANEVRLVRVMES